ncbi:MAG: hypothetical protein MZV65_12870 [Chromatiales bacterium]|nr:hypothetical protein [Chromatiales bacterium]
MSKLVNPHGSDTLKPLLLSGPAPWRTRRSARPDLPKAKIAVARDRRRDHDGHRRLHAARPAS